MLVFPLRAEGWFTHKPHATAGLVIANWLVALLIGCTNPFFGLFEAADPALLDSLVLWYGKVRPWTWITSAFVHANVAHLAGNMMFLLAFGMVVEGIVGWRVLLTLYLGVAAAQGAIEQALFFGTGSGSLGASGAIFGLVAAAWIWAPRERVTVWYWIFRFVGHRALPVTALAGWWIGWEVVWALMRGFELGSSVLHLLGAGLGFGAAFWLLRTGRVDCHGGDWLTLREQERHREALAEIRTAELGVDPLPQPKRWTAAELVRDFIERSWPVVAALLIGAGLLLIYTADWNSDQGPGGALARTLIAFALIGAGAFLFWRWKRS